MNTSHFTLSRTFLLCTLTFAMASMLEARPGRSGRTGRSVGNRQTARPQINRPQISNRSDRKTLRPRDEERQARQDGTATLRPRDEERQERKQGTLRPRDEEREARRVSKAEKTKRPRDEERVERRFDRRDTPVRSAAKADAVKGRRQSIDGDGDGKISQSEREAARSMKSWDSNGDGALSQDEIDAGKANAQDKAQAAQENWVQKKDGFVEAHDANGDGQIDQSELREAYDQARAEAADQVTVYYSAYADEHLTDEQQAAVEAAVEAARQRKASFLAKYDANGDGMIDASEFGAAVKDIKASVE